MQQLESQKPELQMFICTRTKTEGACCGPKGAMALRENIRSWVKEQGLQEKVKITASLCLGHCEKGITICIHPDNEWLVNVDADRDIESLKKMIVDKIASRL